MNSGYKELISQYIKAKDENKPHLMSNIFSKQATLVMKVETDNVSFPSKVVGLNDISDVLVSHFNKSYENIYTVCFLDTLQQNVNTVYCRWLVGMTVKSSKELRVGYGEYQWTFDPEQVCLVESLLINIRNMIVLPQEYQSEVMFWFYNISSYPWAKSAEVLNSMPNISLLTDVRENMMYK